MNLFYVFDLKGALNSRDCIFRLYVLLSKAFKYWNLNNAKLLWNCYMYVLCACQMLLNKLISICTMFFSQKWQVTQNFTKKIQSPQICNVVLVLCYLLETVLINLWKTEKKKGGRKTCPFSCISKKINDFYRRRWPCIIFST